MTQEQLPRYPGRESISPDITAYLHPIASFEYG